MNKTGAVELESLHRCFAEGDTHRVVLDDASMHVSSGEVVMLLGRSGSGKSTLLNLISGIDLPDSGRVLVNGFAVHAADERERTLFRRRTIGFIFQSFNLIPTLTVAENVELPLALLGVDESERIERTRMALEELDLGSRGDAFTDNLSGGERQRVAVARALIHRPAVILADEPTGNLDSENADTVLNLLLQLQRRDGATLIMATHSLAATRHADRVLRVRDGRVFNEAAGQT